jgi:hypothetical protein
MIDTATATTADAAGPGAGFGGYWRANKRARWERLVPPRAGQTYDSVWGELLDAVEGKPAGGELLVSVTDPNPPVRRRF